MLKPGVTWCTATRKYTDIHCSQEIHAILQAGNIWNTANRKYIDNAYNQEIHGILEAEHTENTATRLHPTLLHGTFEQGRTWNTAIKQYFLQTVQVSLPSGAVQEISYQAAHTALGMLPIDNKLTA
jgi:hypothetical protein